jgi:hypothetical protein
MTITREVSAQQLGRLPRYPAANCETEDKTGAEVCVTVTRASIDCNKAIFGEYYEDCDVRVNYELTTNYAGRGYLDVDMECKVEIEYSGRDIIFESSESGRKDSSRDLYANNSTSESMRFNFSFSPFEKPTRVRIQRAACEIDSMDLY